MSSKKKTNGRDVVMRWPKLNFFQSTFSRFSLFRNYVFGEIQKLFRRKILHWLRAQHRIGLFYTQNISKVEAEGRQKFLRLMFTMVFPLTFKFLKYLRAVVLLLFFSTEISESYLWTLFQDIFEMGSEDQKY